MKKRVLNKDILKKNNEDGFFRLNPLKFGLAGGIYGLLVVVLSTVFSIFNFPGFTAFTNILVGMYGWWGYSVSWIGVLIGGFYGFVEGFIHLLVFAYLYNYLLRK